MPSFGRPFKHSNRSQQALPEPLAGAPPSVVAAAAPAGATTTSSTATTASTGSRQRDLTPANSATNPRQALASPAFGAPASAPHNPRQPQQQHQHQHQHQHQQQLADPLHQEQLHQEQLHHHHPHPNLRQLAQQQQHHHQQQQQRRPNQHDDEEEEVEEEEETDDGAAPQHHFNPNSWPLPQTPSSAAASPSTASSPALEFPTDPPPASTDASVVTTRARAHIPAGRKHTHRLSTVLLQQAPPFIEQQQQQAQHGYGHGIGIASTSYDDLPQTVQYHHHHQPTPSAAASSGPSASSPLAAAPAPEKRSARKLIKGIFSGSSRSTHDGPHHQHHHSQPSHPLQHQQHNAQGRSTFSPANHHTQSSESSSTGVVRRHSKRISTPPNLKTGFSQQPRHTPRRDWSGTQSQTNSPLTGPDEFHEHHEYRFPSRAPHQDIPPQTSQPLLDNSKVTPAGHNTAVASTGAIAAQTTIRQVVNDPDTSAYDDKEDYEPPQQPHSLQQPPLVQHRHRPSSPYQSSLQQDQNHHYDDTGHDQQLLAPNLEQQHEIQQSQFDHQQQEGLYQRLRDQRVLLHHQGPNPQFLNADTVSQNSYESPVTDPDQLSSNQHSIEALTSTNYPTEQLHDVAVSASQPPGQLVTTPQSQQPGMASGIGLPQHSRRIQSSQTYQAQALAQAQEAEQALQGQIEPPPGPPPGYRHSASSVNQNMSPLPPPSQQQSSGGVSQPYRGERPPPQFETQGTDQGRDSPSLLNPDQGTADAEKAFKELLVKYKNVKRLYFDGKSQIEQLSGQVEQLQNAVANQRMSQSRTALDDNEYTTRFSRLNGAINNLSFNIRKDWRTVPQWLEKFISPDALKTGKQEMTAVGRAIISRWLVEEVFNKCFHPGLDPALSAQLKEIEISIRGSAHHMQSQEEYDALTTRIVNWRMATLDGLQRRLNSPATAEHRTILINKATTNLTACLYQYLANPPPAGVEGSTSMIVELAVGIAANLPLESRDVAIMYPLPGDLVQPLLMEVEKTGLPVLEGQKPEAEADGDEEGEREKMTKLQKGKPAGLSAMMAGNAQARKGSTASNPGGEDVVSPSVLAKDVGIVRFAGFVALEVRGRQVLMKAPVWTL